MKPKDRGKVATNIRFSPETWESLRLLAYKERKSVAQLIREAVEQTYSIAAPDDVDPRKDPFAKLIGAFKSGIADGSVEHDRDIYGIGG